MSAPIPRGSSCASPTLRRRPDPLYDVASALPYGRDPRALRFALKIGGDYRVVPQHDTWPMAAHALGLGREQAIGRVPELAERAPDAFRDAADEPDVVALGRPLPSRLVDLVRDRVSARVAILDRPMPPQSEAAQALGPT
jgi:serine/threonine-protein kinase HipA